MQKAEFMSLQVQLTEIRQSDSAILFKWINDHELVTFNSNYRPVHFPTHEEWIERVIKNKEITIFAIRLKESDALIGTCQIHSIDPTSRTGELQIRIGDSKYQSKGYGTQSVELLVEFGFKSLNLHKIYLHVFEDNIRAHKTYLKCSFEVEGVLKKHVFVDGEYKNLLIMSRFKN